MENKIKSDGSLYLRYNEASLLAEKKSIENKNSFYAVKDSENTNLLFDVILSYPCLAGDVDDRQLYLLYLNGHQVYSLYNPPKQNYGLLLNLHKYLVKE